MRAFPWILGSGAAALAAYYWRRDRQTSSAHSDSHNRGSPASRNTDRSPNGASSSTDSPERLPGRWVWPVGVWHDRKPEISDGFSSKRHLPTGQVVTHGGVDIMYRRRPDDPWRAGTQNGTPGWVMPEHRAALAASDGVVLSAASTPRGCAVVVDHAPRKLATYYTHLSSLLVVARQPVSAGAPLGIIGADPLDSEHIMHLHFELWRGAASDRFDPQRLIETTWEYVPDPGDVAKVLFARNGTHRPKDGSSFTVDVRPHTRRSPRR
jgi:murein DD-endopeptidase MepM/ murein hydrolase activator NlpD